MLAYETLKNGLLRLGLENIRGSAFDNAFEVFNRGKDAVNLVVIGTNGNSSDRKHSTLGWLNERAREPQYNHIRQGDWGRSRLQSQLLDIPRCLNEVFAADRFSEELTIYTNALLLASNNVGDIGNRVELLDSTGSKEKRKRDIIEASMRFFSECTLSLARPDLLFAYGNAEDKSAWAYIRRHFRVVADGWNVPLTASTSYKFCSIEIHNKILPVVGSPHLSWRYNRLNATLIRQGFAKLGVAPSL